MSQVNPFLAVLQTTGTAAPNARQPALDVLDQFAQAVAQYWQGRMTCSYVPGYATSYGQEYRVVVRATRTGYEHTVFRAYVPMTGRPIRADYYESELVEYADAPALEVGLKLFLARPETQDAINAYALA